VDIGDIDLTELREMWARRRAAAAPFRALVDPTGMTRPARDPDERAFLAERDALGPFVEVDHPSGANGALGGPRRRGPEAARASSRQGIDRQDAVTRTF